MGWQLNLMSTRTRGRYYKHKIDEIMRAEVRSSAWQPS